MEAIGLLFNEYTVLLPLIILKRLFSKSIHNIWDESGKKSLWFAAVYRVEGDSRRASKIEEKQKQLAAKVNSSLLE